MNTAVTTSPFKIEHYCLSLLDNIYSEIEEVSLNENLRIVRLGRLTDPRAEKILGKDALEVSRVVDYTKGPPKKNEPFGFHEVYFYDGWKSSETERWAETSNHALEYFFEGEFEKEPEKEDYDQVTPLKLFNYVLSAFRLLKPQVIGRFRASDFFSKNITYKKGIRPPDNYYWPEGADTGVLRFCHGEIIDYERPLYQHEPYIFHKEDIKRLKSVFDALCSHENAQIQIALSYLNRSYAREHEIDKLIDIMIAFEALYLKGEKAELKFRLSTRVAKHMGKNAGQSKNIYECISNAYDIRCAIAHGAVNSLKEHKAFQKRYWDSPRSMLKDLSNLLRKSLQAILSDVGVESFVKDFHAKLDEALISGEPFGA